MNRGLKTVDLPIKKIKDKLKILLKTKLLFTKNQESQKKLSSRFNKCTFRNSSK